VVGIAVGGFLLRLVGVNFGLPAIYRPDENVGVGRAMGVLHGVLDPNFADWPHFFFYLSAAWLAPVHLVGLVQDQASAHLWVRGLSVLLGTLTVLMVADFGRRAYGWGAALIGGAGLSVAFLSVRDSHFGTPDVALALAVIGALYIAYRASGTTGIRPLIWNGIALGIAASLKYNGALVLLGTAASQAWGARAGFSLPALAIQYCLRNPNIGCVLVGAKTAREVEEDVLAATLPISEDTWQAVDERIRHGSSEVSEG